MISTAIQKGTTVYVYGERNNTLFTQIGELRGYTGSTVSISKNGTVYTYGERGNLISTQIERR